MKPAASRLANAINLGLLAGAWLYVPRNLRTDWWREWRAEIWQARNEYSYDGGFSWAHERAIASFCLGAYQDAFCLRLLERRTSRPHKVAFGAAWQCLVILGIWLVASYAVMRVAPGVRAKEKLSPATTRAGVILLKYTNNENSPLTISSGQYLAWKDQKQGFFDGFAFYRLTKENVSWQQQDKSRDCAGWGVARASSNFFTLLGVPVQFKNSKGHLNADTPALVLSERAWRRIFAASPDVVGSKMRLGSLEIRIVGVLPDGVVGLPGNVDAWLLEPDSHAIPVSAGYVVAHLTPIGRSKLKSGTIQITGYAPHRTPDDLLGTCSGKTGPQPGALFLFAMLLAVLALPTFASFSLSEYSVSLHEISWVQRVYLWSFLFAKMFLILPAVYFSAIDISYGFVALDTTVAVYAQLAFSVLGCLFGLGWALSDQCRRCPVCLERVAHPARVGQLSRTFLAWSGTELMCTGGHTLLHIPTLPTSWFSTQRWMFLDPSWKFLFADPVRERIGPTILLEF